MTWTRRVTVTAPAHTLNAQTIAERDAERAHADMLALSLATNGWTSASMKNSALATHRNRRNG